MSWQAVQWASVQDVPSAAHGWVLVQLAHFADQNGRAHPKQATLARKARVSVRTIVKIVSDLERDGFLNQEKKRRNDGKQAASVYHLNLWLDTSRVQNLQSGQSAEFAQPIN